MVSVVSLAMTVTKQTKKKKKKKKENFFFFLKFWNWKHFLKFLTFLRFLNFLKFSTLSYHPPWRCGRVRRRGRRLLLLPCHSTVSYHPPGRPGGCGAVGDGCSCSLAIQLCHSGHPRRRSTTGPHRGHPGNPRGHTGHPRRRSTTSHNMIYDSWLYTRSPSQPPLQLHERRSTTS